MARETLRKSFSALVKQDVIGQDVIISNIVSDSRKVNAGSLFCAVAGAESDGHDFIDSAIDNGAAAIVMECPKELAVPSAVNAQLKSELSDIASRFYDEPTKKMHMIGVTGTNGKSSVVSFVRQLLSLLGENCASIGTLGVEILDATWATDNTTPGAIELQKLCYDVSQEKVKNIAVEVSSHALDQYRCEAIHFDTAIFTNLTHDHLDYHQTMEAYLQAKKKLFLMSCLQNIIINQDDEYSKQIQSDTNPAAKCWSYSLGSDSADLYLHKRTIENGKQVMQWCFNGEIYKISSPLVGLFNIANLMAAFLAVIAKGFDPKLVAHACSNVVSVAGRMQFIPEHSKEVLAIVDYAHTPDALANTLQALVEYKKAKLICVFGCGGDRDKAKRPEMAKIAEYYCDAVIVTADNPRKEKNLDIAEDICKGFSGNNYKVIHDRKDAITEAVAMANADDVIVVAGKGHEKYQIIGNQVLDFDDVEVLAQLLGGDVCH